MFCGESSSVMSRFIRQNRREPIVNDPAHFEGETEAPHSGGPKTDLERGVL